MTKDKLLFLIFFHLQYKLTKDEHNKSNDKYKLIAMRRGVTQ
jgi:hypothetical protein